jgi:hypothetical protein
METTAMKPTTSKPNAKRKHKFNMVNLKGGDEWKAWVDRLSRHCRTDTSKLLDRGLIFIAKMEGFEEEAPQR